MRPLVKSLYIRLLGKDEQIVPEVERRALDNMFMLRTISESTTSQLNFSFVANQNAYEEERDICMFIVRFGTHYSKIWDNE
jgi:5-methylcytosine-specific restriction endonuclease McrBC regulatory subunit McrC